MAERVFTFFSSGSLGTNDSLRELQTQNDDLFNMPRSCKCRKCGKHHGPPTGKRCRETLHETDNFIEQPDNDMLSLLLDIKKQLSVIEKRVSQVKGASAGSSPAGQESPPQQSNAELAGDCGAAQLQADITPTLLRQNTKVMGRAARRLAQIWALEEEDDNTTEFQRSREGDEDLCWLPERCW